MDAWRSWLPRCKSLTLATGTPMIRELLDQLAEMPLLESLHVKSEPGYHGDPLQLGRVRMPKLRELTSDLIPPHLIDSAFPWDQISRISMECVILDNSSFSVLSRCQSLRSLYINITYCSVEGLGPISLPGLEDLTLCFEDEEYTVLLPAILAPALRVLHLEAWHWDGGPSIIPPLISMLTSSGCQLTSMDLNCRDIFDDADELRRLFNTVPSLEELVMKGYYSSDIRRETLLFFRLFLQIPPDDYLVPRLKKLDVSLEKIGIVQSPSDSAISNMLNLRRLLGRYEFSISVLENASIRIWGENGEKSWHMSDGGQVTKEGSDFDDHPE